MDGQYRSTHHRFTAEVGFASDRAMPEFDVRMRGPLRRKESCARGARGALIASSAELRRS